MYLGNKSFHIKQNIYAIPSGEVYEVDVLGDIHPFYVSIKDRSRGINTVVNVLKRMEMSCTFILINML